MNLIVITNGFIIFSIRLTFLYFKEIQRILQKLEEIIRTFYLFLGF